MVTLSKPNLLHFVGMKRSRTEKSSWVKSKAKPGPKKKKIDEFHPDRRKNLAESDKGLWFNQSSLRRWLLRLFLRSTSLSFCFPHDWPQLKRVRLKRDCDTIAFPRSSSLRAVNAGGAVISLARGFSSWHIPLWGRDMCINLWKAKTRTRFSTESLLLKWINRVCRFDGFPWNLVRTFPDRYRTKTCRRFPLF